MIVAIILARASSTRYPNKHFAKIGNKKLIDIVIDNLKKNKLINKIYLATGTKRKNFFFKNIINQKNKNFEIYFHKNEENVTERIYALTKKIKTKYTVIISGDCCLVDNSFIERIYNQIKITNYDFLKVKKKLVHEGITLFKTKAWKNVIKYTKKKHQKEHPGYVVKEFPKLFNIGNFNPSNYEMNKKFRLSVDTESDLDFFNKHYEYLKFKKKNFNLKNVLNSKNFTYLNNHVVQKKAIEKKRGFIIITSVSKKFGLGHLSRSKTIFREINETVSSDVEIVCLGKKFYDSNFIHEERIRFVNKLDNSLFLKKRKIIIDLPNNILSKIDHKLINKKNIIIIDNLYNLKKPKFIIPSIRKNSEAKKNIFSGKDYLIISRKTLLFRSNTSKKKNSYLFLSGSGQLDSKIISLIKNTKNLKLIIGSLVNKNEIKTLKKLKIKFKINPGNYLNILHSAKEVYCKFGVSSYELIAMNKKPIILDHGESLIRNKDIKYLYKKGLIKLIRKNKIISKKKKVHIDINKSLKKLISLIN